jgi:hypothetical protein
MTTQSISNSIKWTSQKASPWSRVRLREWGTRWCHIFGEAAQLSWIRSSGICIIPEHRRHKAIHSWLLADNIGTTRTLEGEGADCGPGREHLPCTATLVQEDAYATRESHNGESPGST